MLSFLPPEGFKILLTLFLSFLVGLEREEHKGTLAQYSFGGVRTFPLIGLFAYGLALISGPQLLPFMAGLIVIGAFMFLSYQHKIASLQVAGLTSEISALTVYAIGGLVATERYWIAGTLVVIGLLLLELKSGLENLAKTIPVAEIFAFTKFLLISAVILPILPHEAYTRFQIVPFKIWIVVVAVNAISYGSYVLQKIWGETGGVLLSSILGGAYSSTVTTVTLAKVSQHEKRPHTFSGSMLMASGMMYVRLVLLVGFFSGALLKSLASSFCVLALAALSFGFFWSRKKSIDSNSLALPSASPGNPLELGASFVFAALFVVIMIVTRLALEYLGKSGVFALAALMGITDVDPFILGIAQSASTMPSLTVASASIVIAASSNNLIKGVYAYSFSERQTGRQGFVLLFILALLGLVPLFWILS